MADKKEGQGQEDSLTEMEEWILRALATGRTRRELCRELGISHSLYHYHLHAIRRYFRVRTNMEAVLAYVRRQPAGRR